jgi:hypothetical protein
MKLDNLNLVELNTLEVKEVEGGLLFGLVCITGVLDGIKRNTEFHRFQTC